MCISWCANYMTLRNARYNAKGKERDVLMAGQSLQIPTTSIFFTPPPKYFSINSTLLEYR